MKLAARILLFALISTNAGCVSWLFPSRYADDRAAGELTEGRKIRHVERGQFAEQLKPGQTVRVLTKREKRYQFRVTSVESESFIGKDRDGKAFRVPYKHIRALGIRESKTDSDLVEDWAIYSADQVVTAAVAAAIFSGMFACFLGCG